MKIHPFTMFARNWKHVGVTEKMEYDSTFRKSSPSGSPLKRFGDGEPKDSDWEWYDLFPKVEQYLKLGDANSFELPWNNDIWNFALCEKTLKNAGHNYHTKVRLCKRRFVTKDGNLLVNVRVFHPTQRFSLKHSNGFQLVTFAMIQGAKRALRA